MYMHYDLQRNILRYNQFRKKRSHHNRLTVPQQKIELTIYKSIKNLVKGSKE